VDQLARVHTDADACLRLRRKYSDLPAPPWGARYVSGGNAPPGGSDAPSPTRSSPTTNGLPDRNRRSPCRPTTSRAHSLHGA
jgi:hypothetical protein